MKRAATALILLIGLALGFAHWVDLVNFYDFTTGFCLQGEAWWRYAVMAGAALLLLVASPLAAKVPDSLQKRSPAMGWCALFCSVAWAMGCGLTLAVRSSDDWMGLVLGVLYGVTALWFLLVAVARSSHYIDAPTGSAWMGVLGTVSFYLLTVYRFGFRPAALSRVCVAVEVLSVLAALLYTSALVRATYLPGAPGGRRLYLFGLMAFCFCTCLEAPQTICLWMADQNTIADLALSLALGLTGLLGACSALGCLKEAPAPTEEGGREAA